MTEQVVYEMNLRDKLSAGIEAAKGHVDRLEQSLGGVKRIIEGIGIGLLAFKGAEFIKESAEEWEKMEFSISQVESALKSTGGAAGLTFDELKKGAEDTAHNLKFTQAEILGMQSVLLTFPAVTRETFGEASTIIEDMSTRLGQDLKSSTIQVGKALQDPARGITALRRVGVNFNETQVETIKNLVATNHAADAQALILKELKFEFGGAAEAAAEADKSFRFDKTVEENKVALGELIDKIKEDLMPAMIGFANGVKAVIGFLKEHWGMIKATIVGLTTMWAAFKLLGGAKAILSSIASSMLSTAAAAEAGAASTSAFSLALDISPLGAFALALGAIAAAYYAIADAEETARKKKEEYLGNVKNDELDFVQQRMAGMKGKDKKTILAQAIQEETADIARQKSDLQRALNDENARMAANAAKGQDITWDFQGKENIETISRDLEKIKAREEGLAAVQKNGIPNPVTKGSTTAAGQPGNSTKTKATGTRAITINVSIKELIGIKDLNTTNIREGMSRVKEAVVGVMTSAVNDFQIVAGQ